MAGRVVRADGSTRAELLRGAAAGAAGLVLAGCGERSPSRRAGAAVAARAPVHDFRSRPDLKPPVVSVLRDGGSTAAGLLFLAPSSGPGQRGCLILDDDGDPVWFRPTVPATAMNLRAALYRGEPVLTWWEGKSRHGLSDGTYVVVDRSYRVVARFPAGAGRPSDMHELLLTPDGTALVTSYEVVRTDLRRAGGSRRGRVVGGIVQELELPSGTVLFEWHSLDHVPVEESHTRVGPRFDYFHINAIDVAADGNLLVSARNTWTVYKLDRRSGRVIWRLGGRRSDFAMGRGTVFAWQHDAREHAGGTLLSLFDNGGSPRVQPQSKGLVLALDTRRMEASLHRAYANRPAMRAHALGSLQLLPNGNALVGWGTEPYFTEFDAAGEQIYQAKLPRGGQNYRTLRFRWTATPAAPPDLAAGGGRLLYASWNGATEVAAWQLNTGRTERRLAAGPTTPRRGFETPLHAPSGARYATAVAVDELGRALGTSAVVRI
jgi:outer membrane protein assembly factor BamB